MAWALAELSATELTARNAMRKVREVFARRQLNVYCRHLPGWLALARPDLYEDRWPGLGRMYQELRHACSTGTRLLDAGGTWRQHITWYARHYGLPLTHFLALHETALVHQLVWELRGSLPSRDTIATLMQTCGGGGMHTVQGQARIVDHTNSIVTCVNAMAEHGFPTAGLEICMLLLARGVRLTKEQMRDLPLAVPGLAYAGGWYFPEAEQPVRFLGCRCDDPELQLFRGFAPMGLDSTGQASFAKHLVHSHPEGCSLQQCQALLRAWNTGLDERAACDYTAAFRRNAWLLPISETRFTVDPDLVCTSLRQFILANCTQPGSWLAHRHMPDAASQTGETPADGHGVRESRLVFGLLAQAVQRHALDSYLQTDCRGRQVFHNKKIRQQLLASHPGLCDTAIRDCLAHELPAHIDRTLAARQWLKAPASREQLAASLATLQARLPLLAFTDRSVLAAWVNRIDPEHYCTAKMLSQYIRRLPNSEARAVKKLDELIGGASLSCYLVPECRLLDLYALRNQLGLQGISITRKRLMELVLERRDAIAAAQGDPVDARLWDTSSRRQARVREIMALRKLEPGSPMPSWPLFEEALEQVLQVHAPGGARRHFSGSCAMEIYGHLELELAQRPSPRPTADPLPEPAPLPQQPDGAADLQRRKRTAGEAQDMPDEPVARRTRSAAARVPRAGAERRGRPGIRS
ncbi:hypothetical protein GT347_18300 [Xylophilus rhododendri]|uniref:Uncharacterized protein n=1 Tax=Xylophilus rhododendri TaxID=2697032 RepID=A0A857J7R9_9BURK|nr:hypothetical protein [Xylophilus rhododendri]QHI99757.1 hypothetical protein GT347_18300 [Xylophilus rhododendri]